MSLDFSEIASFYAEFRCIVFLFFACDCTGRFESFWILSLIFGGNVRYKNPKDMLLKIDNKFPHRTISCGNVTVGINILKTGFPEYVHFNSPTH